MLTTVMAITRLPYDLILNRVEGGGVNHISPDFVNVGNIEKNLASMLSTFCPRIFFNLY